MGIGGLVGFTVADSVVDSVLSVEIGKDVTVSVGKVDTVSDGSVDIVLSVPKGSVGSVDTVTLVSLGLVGSTFGKVNNSSDRYF